MGSKGSHIIKSFKYAISGIRLGFRQERNMRIHFLIGTLTILAGIYYNISPSEWLAITIIIGLVIAFELINTAIETIVDMITQEFHPLAKVAKDTAAGAVLVLAVTSIVIGLIIFLPKIF
jgi:diacylglycerol kinase